MNKNESKRRRIKNILYSQKIAPYVFVAPFAISFLVFWLLPITKGCIMSFQKVLPGQVEWVNLKNYNKLLGDRIFLVAIKNSIRYMIGTLVILIPLPMLLAYIISSKLMKFKNIFKSAMFLPALTSVVVAGTIFRMMFGESSISFMNQVISQFDFDAVKWLKNDLLAYVTLLILATWRWQGVNMLYFLAGLSSIPDELYESAAIDGARGKDRFLHISMPMLKPTIIYVLTISIYGGLSMFTESYMLWAGKPSPQNIGLTIVGYLYQQGIERNNMGYAATVGVVLLVITLSLNVMQLKVTGLFNKED